MSQLSVKLPVTQRGKHSFQVSTRTVFQTATSVNQLGFFRYPDAGFRLIFFRKDCLNSLQYILTSQLFMVDFCCQIFRRKTEE